MRALWVLIGGFSAQMRLKREGVVVPNPTEIDVRLLWVLTGGFTAQMRLKREGGGGAKPHRN